MPPNVALDTKGDLAATEAKLGLSGRSMTLSCSFSFTGINIEVKYPNTDLTDLQTAFYTLDTSSFISFVVKTDLSVDTNAMHVLMQDNQPPQLSRCPEPSVIERETVVGGNAASFFWSVLRYTDDRTLREDINLQLFETSAQGRTIEIDATT